MDPLLVITNSDAGTCRRGVAGRRRWRCCASTPSVEVAGDLEPRRARRRPAPRRAPGGSWSPAATAACTRSSPRSTGATSSRTRCSACCRSAPATTSPAPSASRSTSRRPPRSCVDGAPRPMDLIVDEVGEIVVNNVHAGAGAQASRRGASWKDRLHVDRRRQAQPRQARLPDRRRDGRGQAAVHPAARSRSTARSSSTSTSRSSWSRSATAPSRRRHRAHPARRPGDGRST